MEHIKENSTLPVPFNILPSPKFVFKAVQSLYHLVHREKDPTTVFHPGRVLDRELFHDIELTEVSDPRI